MTKAKRIISIILCGTLLSACSAKDTDTMIGGSHGTLPDKSTEKAGKDKLEGVYSTETSAYSYNEESDTRFSDYVTVSYQEEVLKYSPHIVNNRFYIKLNTNLDENLYSFVIHDQQGQLSPACNTPAKAVDSIVNAGMQILNNNSNYNSDGKNQLFKKYIDFSIDDVYTTEINGRETAFFEGKSSYDDETEGYLCGYAFILNGKATGFVSGTWDGADNNAKKQAQEFSDIAMRTMTVDGKNGNTEAKPADVKDEEYTELTTTDSMLSGKLPIRVPSGNALVQASGGLYYNTFDVSLFAYGHKFEDGVEQTPENALEKMTDIYYLSNPAAENGHSDLKVDGTETVRINGIDMMRFDGTVEIGRPINAVGNSAYSHKGKVYGYAFVYDNNACLIMGTLANLNQSDSRYQNVVKMVDDVANFVQPALG